VLTTGPTYPHRLHVSNIFDDLKTIRDGHSHVRGEPKFPIAVTIWTRHFVIITILELAIHKLVFEQSEFIIVV
jgi:hypothetical protein